MYLCKLVGAVTTGIIFETLCYIIYLVRNLILYICNVLSHKSLRSELRKIDDR